MTAADRLALILGRAIIRAESLEAELQAARQRAADTTKIVEDVIESLADDGENRWQGSLRTALEVLNP